MRRYSTSCIYRDRLKSLLETRDETGMPLCEIAVLSCQRNLERLKVTKRSKIAWIRAKLAEEQGWSRITERAAMELYMGASRVLGSRSWPLGFLRRGAVEAIYHRSVR
jgi:hypothetical protein